MTVLGWAPHCACHTIAVSVVFAPLLRLSIRGLFTRAAVASSDCSCSLSLLRLCCAYHPVCACPVPTVRRRGHFGRSNTRWAVHRRGVRVLSRRYLWRVGLYCSQRHDYAESAVCGLRRKDCGVLRPHAGAAGRQGNRTPVLLGTVKVPPRVLWVSGSRVWEQRCRSAWVVHACCTCRVFPTVPVDVLPRTKTRRCAFACTAACSVVCCCGARCGAQSDSDVSECVCCVVNRPGSRPPCDRRSVPDTRPAHLFLSLRYRLGHGAYPGYVA